MPARQKRARQPDAPSDGTSAAKARKWPRFRRDDAMRLDPALQAAMLKAVPELRAFAVGLCHQHDRADDLVQEALLHAIDRIETFTPGTNMTAWLFTILRNHF